MSPAAPNFDLDEVLPRILRTWWAGLPRWSGLAAVVLAPGVLVAAALAPAPDALAAPSRGLFGTVAAAAIVRLFFTALAVGTLVPAVLAELEGRAVPLSVALSAGLRGALPAAGTALAFAVGVGLGCFACAVPGIVLASLWFVAVPTAVVEGVGVGTALGRSLQRVRPVFLPIAFVVGLLWVGVQGIGLGVLSVLLAVFGGPAAGALGGWALGVFGTALIAVAQTVVYRVLVTPAPGEPAGE